MKMMLRLLIAGASASLAMTAPCHAENSGAGHWAWVSDPVIGPRAAPPSHHRVWIPDQPVNATYGKGAGHWQWVTEFGVGPRAGAPLSHRVWVSE